MPLTLEEFIEYIKSGFIIADNIIDLDILVNYIENNSHIDNIELLKHSASNDIYYVFARIKIKDTNVVLAKDLKIFTDKNNAEKYYNLLLGK